MYLPKKALYCTIQKNSKNVSEKAIYKDRQRQEKEENYSTGMDFREKEIPAKDLPRQEKHSYREGKLQKEQLLLRWRLISGIIRIVQVKGML